MGVITLIATTTIRIIKNLSFLGMSEEALVSYFKISIPEKKRNRVANKNIERERRGVIVKVRQPLNCASVMYVVNEKKREPTDEESYAHFFSDTCAFL